MNGLVPPRYRPAFSGHIGAFHGMVTQLERLEWLRVKRINERFFSLLLYSFSLSFKHNSRNHIHSMRLNRLKLHMFNFRGLNCNVLANGPSAKMVPDHVRIKPT